jgi:hypothetical protein
MSITDFCHLLDRLDAEHPDSLLSDSESSHPIPNIDMRDLPPIRQEPSVSIMEEIYKLRYDIAVLRTDMTKAFSAMDFKKIKKNRTLVNRCTFVNRRGDSCRGYKCKVPGSTLCYAHHILSTSSQYPEKRSKLY